MKSKNAVKVICFLLLIIIVMVLASLLNNVLKKRMYPRKYSEYVEKYSDEYDVPEYIVYSVIYTESSFDEKAVSGSGACGLMQIMPSTYSWLVSKFGEEEKDIYDPEENIKYGTYYLSYLYGKYNDWEKVFASYNAGPNNVDMWLKEEEYTIKFKETKNYVDKLRLTTQRYKEIYY